MTLILLYFGDGPLERCVRGGGGGGTTKKVHTSKNMRTARGVSQHEKYPCMHGSYDGRN